MRRASPRSMWFAVNQRFASSRFGAWVFARILHRIDRVLMRLTGGRVSIPRVFAGLPVIQLTTVGARTGTRRIVPVLGLRDGEDWIVIASNWGQTEHPAWYHNLKANPTVTVTHRDRSAEYEAREVTGEEKTAYWDRATEVYLGFSAYRDRAGDRAIPVVVLSPIDE